VSGLLARLKRLVETEPAALLYGLAAIAPALLAAFGVPRPVIGGTAAILTALASAVAAFRARPVAVPVILGAAGTALSALTAFGLHLTPQVTGEILAGLNLFLGFAFRASLTPVVTLRAQGRPA
jgi:hypothetical protein